MDDLGLGYIAIDEIKAHRRWHFRVWSKLRKRKGWDGWKAYQVASALLKKRIERIIPAS